MPDYLTVLENVQRPRLLASAVSGAWKVYAIATSMLAAFVGMVLQLMGVIVPARTFLLLAGIVFGATVLLALSFYLRDWWRYVRRIEEAFDGVRRKMLIYAGWHEDAPAPAIRIPMLSVVFDHGTGSVRIIVEVAAGVGLQVNSRLAMVLTSTNQVFGVLIVNSVHAGYAWAVPHDRREPEFWRLLEDRASGDPSPPEGFHLEADIPDFLRYEPAPGGS